MTGEIEKLLADEQSFLLTYSLKMGTVGYRCPICQHFESGDIYTIQPDQQVEVDEWKVKHAVISMLLEDCAHHIVDIHPDIDLEILVLIVNEDAI